MAMNGSGFGEIGFQGGWVVQSGQLGPVVGGGGWFNGRRKAGRVPLASLFSMLKVVGVKLECKNSGTENEFINCLRQKDHYFTVKWKPFYCVT